MQCLVTSIPICQQNRFLMEEFNWRLITNQTEYKIIEYIFLKHSFLSDDNSSCGWEHCIVSAVRCSVWCWFSLFHSCLSGVSTPRSQRQRSRTCWIRSSVQELCSIFCVLSLWVTRHRKNKKVASKNANRADTLSLCSSETNELHFFWVQKPVAAVADD